MRNFKITLSTEEIISEEELLDIINYCYDTNYLTFSDIPAFSPD